MGVCKHRSLHALQPVVKTKARENQTALAVTLIHEYAHTLLHYEVQSAPGNTYEVDVASKTCTCPDFTKRQPSGGCKHLRRVDIEIRSGIVPRPDGWLPATADVTERLSERILELEQEIEERETRRRDLEATVAVLEEYSVR